MAQTVQFEGQTHQFPDDFSQADISAALATVPAAPSAAPAPAAAPPVAAAPPTAELPAGNQRSLMIGAQGTGRGIADIVGMAPDIVNMGVNTVLSGADAASQKLGGPAIDYRFPLASEEIAKTADRASNAVGLPTVTPETLKEKGAYNISRYGTQAMTGANLLSMLAKPRAATIAAEGASPKLADEFLRPYFTNPGKAIVGDTVAGGSAGAAVTGTQEIPDNIRDLGHGAVGAGADLIAMLGGGVGGATAYELAHRAPSSVMGALRASMRSRDVPYDPETSLPFTNKQVDTAAKYTQGLAIDPAKAAANIEREVAQRSDAGTPIPTTGIISGDPGLEMLERGQRQANSTGSILQKAAPEVKSRFSFGARDTALRDQAVSDVNALRPEAGVPADVPVRAAERADAQREVAQKGVDRAQGGVEGINRALAAPANELNSFEGQGVGASRNIHDIFDRTRTVEQDASRARFNEPDILNAEVPIAGMRRAADAVLANGTDRVPVPSNVATIARRFATPDVAGMEPEAAAEAMAHADRPITMAEVNSLRADLDAGINKAVADGDGRSATLLRNLKQATGRYQQTLVDAGGPAGTAMEAARAGFNERVAPNFREGTGGEVNKQMRRDANLRPSETADTFLSRPEDAADLMRIARLGGNEAAVTANARTWVMDKLAQRGIARDGEIDPEKLASWRNRNQTTLDQIPGLRQEVDGMVRDARRGQGIATDRADNLLTAQRNQATTEKHIKRGALGAVEGKDAEHAVAAVLGGSNPEAGLTELVRTVGATTQGKLDLQAAVAEHFAKKVSGVAPHNVSEGTQNINFAQLVKEFDKHGPAFANSGLFSPEEMNTLRQAQAQLEPLAKRSGQATTGSITAEGKGVAALLEPGIRLMHGALRGGAEVKKIKVLESLVSNGLNVSQANRLVALAHFDPSIAKVLLTRDVKELNSPLYNKKLQTVIRRVEAAKEIGGSDEE